MGGWVDGWLDGWMDGWMDEWMDGWIDGWMDGWMDEWMDRCRMDSWNYEGMRTCFFPMLNVCLAFTGLNTE